MRRAAAEYLVCLLHKPMLRRRGQGTRCWTTVQTGLQLAVLHEEAVQEALRPRCISGAALPARYFQAQPTHIASHDVMHTYMRHALGYCRHSIHCSPTGNSWQSRNGTDICSVI